MNSQRSSASLRVYSETVSIEEITQLLQLQPTRVLVKGSKVDPNHPKSYVHPGNLWILVSSQDSSQSLESHIAYLVELMEQRIDAWESLLKDCKADLFCGFSSVNGQGGFTLSASLLKRITIIPIALTLDLYPPDSTQDE